MKNFRYLCLPVLCLILISCTKEPLNNLSQAESRIYVTNYDTAARFNAYQTFRLADSIAVIVNNQLQSRQRGEGDALFIDAMASALQARGYTRVNSGQQADLGVTVSAITNTSSHIISYRDYGGYYGGYWDPYYWGYPGYSYYVPTYYGVYESSETALAVDIVDIKNAAANNNQLRVVWSGLIRGSGIFSGQNINSSVAALFEQSPYLKAQ